MELSSSGLHCQEEAQRLSLSLFSGVLQVLVQRPKHQKKSSRGHLPCVLKALQLQNFIITNLKNLIKHWLVKCIRMNPAPIPWILWGPVASQRLQLNSSAQEQPPYTTFCSICIFLFQKLFPPVPTPDTKISPLHLLHIFLQISGPVVSSYESFRVCRVHKLSLDENYSQFPLRAPQPLRLHLHSFRSICQNELCP